MGRHDVVCAVDFGQALAFAGGFVELGGGGGRSVMGDLWGVRWGARGREDGWGGGLNRVRVTHCVAGGVFLLGGGDGASTLGLVQGCLAADDCLTLGAAAVGFAPDLGDCVPIV